MNFNLLEPPKRGLAVFAVPDMDADCLVQYLLDSTGVPYDLAAGFFRGRNEDGFVCKWDDFSPELRQLLVSAGEESLLLVHTDYSFLVDIASINEHGYNVLERLTKIKEYRYMPDGDCTGHNCKWYKAYPTLEKTV